MPGSVRSTLALALSALLHAACGGDRAPAATRGEASDASAGVAASGMPSSCPTAPFSFQTRRAGSGPNETFTAVGALADMQLPLRAYKLYLTDYPLDPERRLLGQVMTKPPGGTVVQVGIMTDYGSDATPALEDWRPLRPGDLALHIEVSRNLHPEPAGEPITTVSIATDRGPTTPASLELEATAEVLYAGEDALCLEVEATSESGIQVSGVVAGKVAGYAAPMHIHSPGDPR
jgi:hypothetical protein